MFLTVPDLDLPGAWGNIFFRAPSVQWPWHIVKETPLIVNYQDSWNRQDLLRIGKAGNSSIINFFV